MGRAAADALEGAIKKESDAMIGDNNRITQLKQELSDREKSVITRLRNIKEMQVALTTIRELCS